MREIIMKAPSLSRLIDCIQNYRGAPYQDESIIAIFYHLYVLFSNF